MPKKKTGKKNPAAVELGRLGGLASIEARRRRAKGDPAVISEEMRRLIKKRWRLRRKSRKTAELREAEKSSTGP